MARGLGIVEGWPAVAWVAGMGAAQLLTAGVLWLRSRSFRGTRAVPPVYRTAPDERRRGKNARGLAIVMISLCALSQLLYVGLHVELVQWLLGGRGRPHIEGDLFFWVFLVNGSCVIGALCDGWRSP